MPGLTILPMLVEDFFYLSCTDVAWTHRAALDALDQLCLEFDEPFSVDLAFRPPIRERSLRGVQHAAGIAFEIGRTLPQERRQALYYAALKSELFSDVLPPYLAGRSVRVSLARGLPGLSFGDVGVHVFLLQTALLEGGLYRGALTGRFCEQTRRGVRRLQLALGLPASGRVGGREWRALLTN